VFAIEIFQSKAKALAKKLLTLKRRWKMAEEIDVSECNKDEEAGRQDQFLEGSVSSNQLCMELKVVHGALSTIAMNHGNVPWIGVYQLQWIELNRV
jgi:hypothetical protein